jgi:nitroreductase
MNIFEATTSLTLTTDFHKKPVDEKIIGLILHTGTHAPTAGNLQEWEFVVVEDDAKKEALSEAALGLRHVKIAPSVIVICADLRKAALKYGKRGELVYAPEDIGGCAAYMGLAANALEIGFDLIKSFDEEEVKNILNLPENVRPLILMPIGYPKGKKEDRKINPFENVTYVNKWNQKIDIDFDPIFHAMDDAKPKRK